MPRAVLMERQATKRPFLTSEEITGMGAGRGGRDQKTFMERDSV